MKTQKFYSAAVMGFVLAMSFVAGGCSSKKAQSQEASADTSAMQPTEVAKNDVKLGKGSSGRAR